MRSGAVFDGIDDGARVDYRSREAAYVDSRPGCRACWARYLCGGGCYADSVVYGQDKLHPKVEHCSYWRAEIAQAIRFYHRLRVSDPLYALVLFGDDLSQMLDGLEPRPPAFTQSPKTF